MSLFAVAIHNILAPSSTMFELKYIWFSSIFNYIQMMPYSDVGHVKCGSEGHGSLALLWLVLPQLKSSESF